MSTRKMAVLCRATSWSNLVEWLPPDGSSLASGFVVGTDVSKKRCYAHYLIMLFLQRTYSDMQVFLRLMTIKNEQGSGVRQCSGVTVLVYLDGPCSVTNSNCLQTQTATPVVRYAWFSGIMQVGPTLALL